MTSKSCDVYQLALEMSRHGALDVREKEEAEQHSATCAECQRALALSAELDQALGCVSIPAPRHAEVSRALAKDRFWLKYGPWVALGSFVGQGVFLGPLFAPEAPLRLWAIVSAVGVLFAGGLALTLRGLQRRAVEAASVGVDAWMAQRRARIGTELKDLATLLWLFPAMSAVMVGSAFLMRDKGLLGVVTLLFAAAVNLGMTVYLARTRRPRLLRERAELEVAP
ncbi:hypothetical protein BHS09_08245 [Myxococcus xanthus]|uniref:Zinc-finger domain-containing protein n=1 Tax=Myxococcus xanthus TaxID=34 RepID=A0AAE6FXA8_MYXXA|nr:hypothetical protein BHS09_08245 [Myxococcus xanthus]QDE74275.1 hypothetical protein BHS08_08250 [Myxococcus xanthus]